MYEVRLELVAMIQPPWKHVWVQFRVQLINQSNSHSWTSWKGTFSIQITSNPLKTAQMQYIIEELGK